MGHNFRRASFSFGDVNPKRQLFAAVDARSSDLSLGRAWDTVRINPLSPLRSPEPHAFVENVRVSRYAKCAVFGFSSSHLRSRHPGSFAISQVPYRSAYTPRKCVRKSQGDVLINFSVRQRRKKSTRKMVSWGSHPRKEFRELKELAVLTLACLRTCVSNQTEAFRFDHLSFFRFWRFWLALFSLHSAHMSSVDWLQWPPATWQESSVFFDEFTAMSK